MVSSTDIMWFENESAPKVYAKILPVLSMTLYLKGFGDITSEVQTHAYAC